MMGPYNRPKTHVPLCIQNSRFWWAFWTFDGPSWKFEGPKHTYHKLWTEICEIRQIFKGDLIKFCEIFTKITLELPKIVKSLYFQCKQLVINTTKCDLCLFLHKIFCKMVWKICCCLKDLMGIGFQMGQILRDFISQCEIWHHVCPRILHSDSRAKLTSNLNSLYEGLDEGYQKLLIIKILDF